MVLPPETNDSEHAVAKVGSTSEELVAGGGQVGQVEAPSLSQEAGGANGEVAASGREPVVFDVQNLLRAGAHFGHQTERWNPKMVPFIYGVQNGVHIINLDFTVRAFAHARKVVVSTVSRGGTVLFVGTKQQAREVVERECEAIGAFHVTTRWLGGTLTNFGTIRNSIERMRRLDDLLQQSQTEGSNVKLNKKERLTIARELAKLRASIGGVQAMRRIPDLLVVLDINKEHLAIKEARRLGIPVIALADTNCDPELVDYPIPCNDDSSRALELFVKAVADAVREGKQSYETRVPLQDETLGEQRVYRAKLRTSERGNRFGAQGSADKGQVQVETAGKGGTPAAQ